MQEFDEDISQLIIYSINENDIDIFKESVDKKNIEYTLTSQDYEINGIRPIVYAINRHKLDIIRICIELESSVSTIKGREELTPLQVVILLESYDIMALFREKNKNGEYLVPNRSMVKATGDKGNAITYASRRNDLIMIKLLHTLGVPFNHRSFIHKTNMLPLTATTNIQTLDLLLSLGADPNLTDCEGKTGLLLACKDLNEQRIRLFLTYNADPNRPIFTKPLIQVIIQKGLAKQKKCLSLLLNAGANPLSIYNNFFTDRYDGLDVVQIAQLTNKRLQKFLTDHIDMMLKSPSELCKSNKSADPTIISIAKNLQIKFDLKVPGKLTKKEKIYLCDCINKFGKNIANIDYDYFSRLRSKGRPPCSNDPTLVDADWGELADNQIISYKDKGGIWHCFESGYIPYLLENKKNPFNRQDLPIEFLERLQNAKLDEAKPLKETVNETFKDGARAFEEHKHTLQEWGLVLGSIIGEVNDKYSISDFANNHDINYYRNLWQVTNRKPISNQDIFKGRDHVAFVTVRALIGLAYVDKQLASYIYAVMTNND